MVVGGRVLRTLETRRRSGSHRVLRLDYNSWLHAPLYALSSPRRKTALGSRSDGAGRFGCCSRLGLAATDVYLHTRESSSVAARTGQRKSKRQRKKSCQTPALDTSSVSPMVESARRVRALPRPVVCLRSRPAPGNGGRHHALEGSSSHNPARVAASARLSGSGAPQPQRHSALSLSARHSALACNAIVHRRMELPEFS